MSSVHEMTAEERELFDQLIEEAKLFGGENPKLYKQLLTDFFDETSEHAHDLEYAQSTLDSKEIKDDIQVQMRALKGNPIKGKVRIGNKIAGSTINVALGFAVGASVAIAMDFGY